MNFLQEATVITLLLEIISSEDTQPQTLFNMMEEGIVVVAIAGTLDLITSNFKRKRDMENKVTVIQNIVRVASKFGRELIFHWIAIILIYAVHLFIPGEAI